MITRMGLSNLIKKLRLKKRMTVTELALRSNVSRPTIYKIERGEIYPRLDTLDMLFRTLNYKYVIGGKSDGQS